ncbi:hypothetical protein ACTU6V_12295 [Microbacterium sp. A204]|uniref:hypothetical protein n=1 Tax=Microbacterium sp. A204 TaxID=3457321 RepID=UPI003FD1404A
MTEAGMFQRIENTRRLRGLLLPFGELSRPNATGNEPIMFSADSVALPRDPSVVTLNVEHDRFNPIGRATVLEKTARGVEAEFEIADTDEGDEYLASPLKKLSAEVAGIVRQGANALRSKLTGAAVVNEGAFASAAMFSIADGSISEIAADQDVEVEGDPEHLVIAAEILPEDVTVSAAGDTRTYTPEAAPAEDNTEQEPESMNASATAPVEQRAVPATLLASAPVAPASTDVDVRAVFSAMAEVKRSIKGQAVDSEEFLAALADIVPTGAGALAADGVLQPAWVGKLWQGKRYTRKYIDLVTHLYGGIQLGGRKGFTLDQGTALVQHWAGNKAELPTGTASTATQDSSLRKYGYGADVALEWTHLEGGAEVLQTFFEGVTDSYGEITDKDALADIMTVALANLVAPGTYAAEYPTAMGMLIDAIEGVQDADDDPTFALVNPVAWRQLIMTPKDLVPEFVTFDFATGGVGTADGKVHVRKAPASAFVGLTATDPAVSAGAARGMEFREQGTTPIQIDAYDIAHGGMDKAIIGYLETFVVRPESFITVGTEA